MSLPPVWDPDAEPLDREIKLCLSTRQLEELDLLVKELNMSRSWILRGALGQGLPLFVDSVRQRRSAGFVSSGEVKNPDAAGPRRGPRSDGLRADRWVNLPGRRDKRPGRGRG